MDNILGNRGRKKILTDLRFTGNLSQDISIAKNIIKTTISQHEENVVVMQKLINYYYNTTEILNKVKTSQPAINNKISIGYPSIASTTKNSYTLSNAPKFVSRNPEKQHLVKLFNDSLDDDSYHNKTMQMALNASMTGLGYKYIKIANDDELKEGIFFKTVGDIDPLSTYCVYANDISKEKVCAIQFYTKSEYKDDIKIKDVQIFSVWSKYHYFEFKYELNDYILTKEPFRLLYNKIPIVENVRTQDRVGDYELGLDIINAINALASSRVDDVQQNVDNVIILRDIDTESEGALDRIKDLISIGILSFKSIEGATVQPNIDVLNKPLNQSEIQQLQDFLCGKLEEVLHIPNRDTRGGGGGDTGTAVESRNGFRSLENIAGLITTSLLESENEVLSVILAICKIFSSCPYKDLTPRDIEIKPMRNKVENLAVATSAFATMISSGVNRVTAYVVSGLVADATDTAEMDRLEQDENFQRQLKQELEKQKQLNATETNATNA